MEIFGISWGKALLQVAVFLPFFILYVALIFAAMKRIFRYCDGGLLFVWLLFVFIFPFLGSIAAVLYFRKFSGEG